MTLGKAIAYLFEFGGVVSTVAAGAVFYSGVSTFSHNEWLVWLLIILAGVSFLFSAIFHFLFPESRPTTPESNKSDISKGKFYLTLSVLCGVAAIVVQLTGVSKFDENALLLWVLIIFMAVNCMRSLLHVGGYISPTQS